MKQSGGTGADALVWFVVIAIIAIWIIVAGVRFDDYLR